MDYWLLITAAAVSLGGTVFHGYVGGRVYMGHIRESNLKPLTRSLSLVAWHVFTIFLLVCALTLVYVAYTPGAALAAWPVIIVNLLGAALFVWLALTGHGHLLRMPGAYLMGTTGILAWLAVH